MIGVIPNETPEKPEITDQLAMSGWNVVIDYTRDRKCDECVFTEICHICFERCPGDLEL